MSLLAPPTAPAAPATSRSAAHGRPVLEAGYGLKDWIGLNRRSVDMSGTQGRMLRVTTHELAKHCTEDDAWTAINGRVYNITPYLKFHPGSVAEIMRGAGKDCTDLFNQYHPYVQFDRFLTKCFVGNLIRESSKSRKISSPAYLTTPGGRQTHLSRQQPSTLSLSPTATSVSSHAVHQDGSHEPLLEEEEEVEQETTSSASTVNTPDSGIVLADGDEPPAINISITVDEPSETSTAKDPRFDWYQTDRTVVVSFYTFFKGLRPTDVLVDVESSVDLTASIFLGERVFTVCWRLERQVERSVVGVRGATVEVTLYKREIGVRWQQLSLAGEESTTAFSDREPLYRKGTLVSMEEVTHNTKLFTFRLPAGSYMSVPVGHHVKLCGMLEGEEVVRSYTPVSSLGPAPSPRGPLQRDTLHLMVKLYSDGKMSRVLSALNVGESLLIGEPEGNFDWPTVQAKRIYLIAAGSGFTPMAKIISAAMGRSDETCVTLLFANQTEKDILWQAELERLQEEFSTRFQAINILSTPSPSWMGLRGRITTAVLQEHLPQPGDCRHGDLLVCVCGMYQFTTGVTQTLTELGYPEGCVHAFT